MKSEPSPHCSQRASFQIAHPGNIARPWRTDQFGAVIGLTGIGEEFEKADIQHPTGT